MKSSASSDHPHSYGRRLLPHVVDERAKTGYARPYASIAKSQNPADGFEDISYARFANAINRACHWLDAELSKYIEQKDVYAYLGPNDLRYAILFLATMKTSRKMLFPSTRNTMAAQLSLFDRTGCKAIVYGASFSKALQPVFEVAQNIKTVQLPELSDLLNEEPVPHYDFHEDLQTISNDRVLYCHTSGSSGNPKPFSWNHQFLAHLDAEHLLPADQGPSIIKSMCEHHRLLNLLPLFHAGGMAFSFFAILYEMTIVLAHPDCPLAADYLASLLPQYAVSSMLTPPSVLVEISKNQLAVESLSKVQHVGYGGGPLHEDAGNLLAAKLPHLFSIIGATEYGWFHLRSGDSSKWDYLSFFDDIGYRFEEVTEGIFELVIVNDPMTNKYHGTFNVLPELSEYRMRDLYSPVPNEKGWWKYRGRIDDLIVLSNGEKINPIPMEGTIQAHPKVRAALVAGEYRFLPSLLIEPEQRHFPATEEERRQFLEAIWPTVEQANTHAPRFAKIPKQLVVFASQEKPFGRAGKGTVQRQFTVKNYSDELDRAYAAAESGILMEDLDLKDPHDSKEVTALVRKIYSQTLDLEELEDGDDVFERGMDSLQVTIVVQKLRAALRSCDANLDLSGVDSKLVYSSPTIASASAAFIAVAKNDQTESSRKTRVAKIQALIDKYSAALPNTQNGVLANRTIKKDDLIIHDPLTIILTGTTGSLGSYLLETLVSLPVDRVAKVYCLNRGPDSEKKQIATNTIRGLRTDFDRVEFLQATLSAPNLGLTESKYTQLLQETTTIVHSAWKVDFNLSLDSFDSQLAGVRSLLHFSTASSHHAHLVFLSSISATFTWQLNNPTRAVPESILSDLDASESIGYGESKYISERLCDAFSAKTGVPTTILRTGQIAGPVLSGSKGVWNRQEWFPSLVASSKHLSLLPSSLGHMDIIDWIPVDLLAQIMTDLITPENTAASKTNRSVSTSPRRAQSAKVYNVVNPRAATWSSTLLPSLQSLLGGDSKIKIVSLPDWVRALESSASKNYGFIVEQNPAVKLLDFFRALHIRPSISEAKASGPSSPTAARARKGELLSTGEIQGRYEVDGLLADSHLARELQAVSPAWLELWMKQWAF